MKTKIGVIGSATGLDTALTESARLVGYAVAKDGFVLLTGACPGVSYEAAKAVKAVGGLVVGFSPAHNLKEHIDHYKFPSDDIDVLVYTGAGLKGRNIPFIRSCDGVVAIAGRIGTMNELTIAYDEGKVIGILKGYGGAADVFGPFADGVGKRSDAKVISDDDATALVKKLVKELR